MKGILLAALMALALVGCRGGVDWDKPWLDSRGGRAPELVVSTYHPDPGGEHCGWGSAVLLHLGWPPGTAAEFTSSSERQYVRDPEGLFDSPGLAPLDLDAKLPPDARYTGYHLDRVELWVSHADASQAAYIVHPDHVERWPRSPRHIFCD